MFIRVRPFDSSDQKDARRIVLEGLGEHFGAVDESLNPDLNDIQSSFIGAGNDFYVAEADGRIVGTAGLLFEFNRSRIVRMSVEKHHRRNGIAKALLSRCIERSRQRSFPEIVAFTEPHWTDAVGFYRRSGFSQYGSDEVDIHLRLSLETPISSGL